MHTVYMALGSNLGNKTANIEEAIQNITIQIGSVDAVSSFFETEPEGFTSENLFLNAACKVITTLDPYEILAQTKQIELQIGRSSKSVNHQHTDRLIDIDILLFDNKVLLELDLTIPHPQMHKRMFVLQPLAEIAPHALHPIFKQTIEELKNQL